MATDVHPPSSNELPKTKDGYLQPFRVDADRGSMGWIRARLDGAKFAGLDIEWIEHRGLWNVEFHLKGEDTGKVVRMLRS